MNMRAGEVVTLIDDSFNDGWALVQKSATEIGIVPALYVEKYTPPELRPGAVPGRAPPPARQQLARVSVAASAPVLRVPPPMRGPPAAARAPVPAPAAMPAGGDADALAQMRAMAEQLKKESQPSLESVCDPGNPEDMYDNFQLCGEGASGSVYSANERSTGRVVAIKKMELARQPNEGVLHNEMSIMKKGSAHENIVTFFNAYLVDGFLWVAMELVDGGSLTEVLEHCPDIEVPQIALVLRDSLRAIEYLHSLDIIHRDIKSDNILIGVDGSIRLTDFGYAAQLTEHVAKRSTVVGTAWWMAPEVIDPAQQYGKQCDIWSFGVMSRECWEKEPPYMEESQTKALFLIMSKGLPPLDYKRPGMPHELQSVVNACCVHDANQRPLASALLQFPFFSMVSAVSALTPLAEVAKAKRAERAAADAQMGEYEEEPEEEWQPFSFGNNNNDEPAPPTPAPAMAPPPMRAPPPMATSAPPINAPPPAAVSAPPPMRNAPPARGLMGPPQHLADELPRGSYHAPPSRAALGAGGKRVMGAPSHLNEPEAPPPAAVAPPPAAMAPPPSMLPPSRAALAAGGPRVMGPPAHLGNGDDQPASPRGMAMPPSSPPPPDGESTTRRALPTPVARRPPAGGPPPPAAAAAVASPARPPPPAAGAAQGGRALPTPAARRAPPAAGGAQPPAPPPAAAGRRGPTPAPPARRGPPMPAPAAAEAPPGEPPADDDYWSD
jgi:hypothetical protein